MTHITDLPEEILFEIYKHLEVSTIKSLQLFPCFTRTTRCYLYRHSLYMLRVTDSDALPKKFQLPGWEISSISAPMRNHVGKFRHYQVNLSLTKIERMVVKLNQASAYLNEIFVAPHGADFKTVKLFIQLNYSLSTFGSVKDCLANVDQLSKYFNRSGKNIVTIDLDLNCREDG